ncbi:MAG: DUF1501 domain-containing protein [Planctomycetaceae bacterium]
MHIESPLVQEFNRRDFFSRTRDGILGMALAHLLGQTMTAPRWACAEPVPPPSHSPTLHPRPTHHTPRATSVIQLFMNGGPSQMDLFDPKPVLNRMDGQPYPGNVEEIGNQGAGDIGVMMEAATRCTSMESRACGWPTCSRKRRNWSMNSA